MIRTGNLFADLPAAASNEHTHDLLRAGAVRIERIVSHGQASPPGFWYDQAWDEWVVLLAGSAAVRFEGDAAPRPLVAGDYLHIPAHVRHRVEWTDRQAATVWLAIHIAEDSAT